MNTEDRIIARQAKFARECFQRLVCEDRDTGRANYNTDEVLKQSAGVSDEAWSKLYDFMTGRSAS